MKKPYKSIVLPEKNALIKVDIKDIVSIRSHYNCLVFRIEGLTNEVYVHRNTRNGWTLRKLMNSSFHRQRNMLLIGGIDRPTFIINSYFIKRISMGIKKNERIITILWNDSEAYISYPKSAKKQLMEKFTNKSIQIIR